MIKVNDRIEISDDDLSVSFVRSSGPGGQNVQKVETAVQLKFSASTSSALSEPVFERLKRLAGRRMDKEGVVTIIAQRFRTQQRNRDDALERLLALLREAAIPPPPPRRPTRPTLGSKERRLGGKKIRSTIKSLRRTTSEDS